MNPVRIVARRIADGIAPECYAGRVSVVNGLVARLEKGDFVPEKGDIFVDENKLLAPGFVDAHGHSDLSLMAMPEAEGKCAQGIAYEISGNCGLSPFPLTELNRAHLQELYRQYRIDLDWDFFNGYQQRLKRCAPALRLFAQVGHNTLRAAVGGYECRHLSADKLLDMCRLLDSELASGAVGLSLGLLYTPGCFADINEITALLKVVAKHNKICTVHLKSEGNALEEALQETLSAARRSGLKKLHLSHLKTAGANNFHKLPALLAALDTPDIRVTGDIYCYTASMTQLSVILPEPFDSYDDVKNMLLLEDDKVFRDVLEKVRIERSSDYWQKVQLISAAAPFDRLGGKFISEAARSMQITPEELFLQIIRRDAVGAKAAFHTLSGDNMKRLAAHPSVVPGSDESARNAAGFEFGSSHPRGFGNHARYFALRRSQGAAPAQVIREMSALAAEIFDLGSIGSIQSGSEAVFNILDMENYCDHAVYSDPHRLASGIERLKL